MFILYTDEQIIGLKELPSVFLFHFQM